jgi:S1-C subfamily serine protease
VVLGVSSGSPADKAGLQGVRQTRRGILLGDVIVGVDDKPVETFDDLYNLLDNHKPGDRVPIKVRRSNQILSLSVELVALP